MNLMFRPSLEYHFAIVKFRVAFFQAELATDHTGKSAVRLVVQANVQPRVNSVVVAEPVASHLNSW